MKTNLLLIGALIAILFSTSCSNDSISTDDVVGKEANKSKLIHGQAKFDFEGKFLKVTQNGTVFYMWGYRGKLRHIDSQATWDGLFSSKPFTFEVNSFAEATERTGYSIGNPLFIDNGLVRYVPTGRVYFREGNKLVYITSEAAFNRYHFSWDAVQNINSFDGLEYTPFDDLSWN
ncbi:hypothetical protein CEY12_02535 [Chryseobacterium sp. T16E-39]|uniref:hypothetical protein n=1 Tax=Chryseobacterium sp. T16E-39 TaxID=2015076 RepID=UPI000B5B4467|nr:hypothetical protein [Chryseobacterium sp. T16E-39]ASK29052.1 hypothetical protein CEY12_02535 [Chryseobacterium sp. T16E-39]